MLLVTTCKSGWSFDHIGSNWYAWKYHGVTARIAEYPNQSSHTQIHCTLNASILTAFHYLVFGTQQIREDLSLATSRNALLIVISNQNWSVDSVGEHSAAASGLPGYNPQIWTANGQESGFETPNGIQMTQQIDTMSCFKSWLVARVWTTERGQGPSRIIVNIGRHVYYSFRPCSCLHSQPPPLFHTVTWVPTYWHCDIWWTPAH